MFLVTTQGNIEIQSWHKHIFLFTSLRRCNVCSDVKVNQRSNRVLASFDVLEAGGLCPKPMLSWSRSQSWKLNIWPKFLSRYNFEVAAQDRWLRLRRRAILFWQSFGVCSDFFEDLIENLMGSTTKPVLWYCIRNWLSFKWSIYGVNAFDSIPQESNRGHARKYPC